MPKVGFSLAEVEALSSLPYFELEYEAIAEKIGMAAHDHDEHIPLKPRIGRLEIVSFVRGIHQDSTGISDRGSRGVDTGVLNRRGLDIQGGCEDSADVVRNDQGVRCRGRGVSNW